MLVALVEGRGGGANNDEIGQRVMEVSIGHPTACHLAKRIDLQIV